MTEVTFRQSCSWAEPACPRNGNKWLKGIPLCGEHKSEVMVAFAALPRSSATRFVPWSSVVYYVTWPGVHDGEVKIGVSSNLSRRLARLRRSGCPPRVLVAEPGGYKAEGLRHDEFRSLRLSVDDAGDGPFRNEIFQRTAELDDHIAVLCRKYPDWATRSKL